MGDPAYRADGQRALATTSPFDPDELRDKYRGERDKRLRADGNQQYIDVKDEFAHFISGPYVDPGFERAPLTDDIDVVVFGSRFGGLLTDRSNMAASPNA